MSLLSLLKSSISPPWSRLRNNFSSQSGQERPSGYDLSYLILSYLIRQYVNQSINQSISQSVDQAVSESDRLIDPSVDQSTNHSIHPLINTSLHQWIHHNHPSVLQSSIRPSSIPWSIHQIADSLQFQMHPFRIHPSWIDPLYRWSRPFIHPSTPSPSPSPSIHPSYPPIH